MFQQFKNPVSIILSEKIKHKLNLSKTSLPPATMIRVFLSALCDSIINLKDFMQKEKGLSIKLLQSQMKKELSRLAQAKPKSQFLSKSLSRINLEMFDEQPERTSLKSNSSRKLDTSITLSCKPPQLIRQCSLEYMTSKNTPSCKKVPGGKICSDEKLKKKRNKKDSPQTFAKLKRGDTLPQHLSGLIVSTTSLELKCDDSGRKEGKSAQEYERMIEKYKKKIDELENIIESMMQ